MKMTTSDNLCPILIEGARGSLVGFYRPPAAKLAAKGDLLVIPAFAEEMNRCRSMVTMQAQALAAVGVGTLVLDMYGTGDSAGDFDEADWEGWRNDLQRGVAWLRQHGNGCHTLLGVRLGALMAAQLAADDEAIQHLLLWRPVVAGKPYWTQFLRIRIAAEMSLANGVKSTNELRQQSARGQVVEASGYLVGSLLAQQLDQLEMPDGDRLRGKTVAWFEVAASIDTPLPRNHVQLADDWRAQGVQVTTAQVIGPPFWQVYERQLAPLLIEASTAAVQAWTLPTGGRQSAPKVVPLAGREMTGAREYPVAFRCHDAELAGIIHRGATDARLGVVIVVAGGPQYRAGAHRQFVSLARIFAGNGYPVLRFDLRGMGDSGGTHLGYQQSRPDIRSAIDELLRREPSVREVALFGECESASGIVFYASQDERVRQIALANPWVRTPEGQAEVILKHYYLERLLSREFWISVRQGKYQVGASVKSFFEVLRTYLRARKTMHVGVTATGQADFDHLPLPSRTAEGLRRFRGPVLLLMSGRDHIAREFDEATKSSTAWEGLLADLRISRKEIADADHTFSKPEAKAAAQQALLAWLADTSGRSEASLGTRTTARSEHRPR